MSASKGEPVTVTITTSSNSPFFGMKVGDKISTKIYRKWWQFWKPKYIVYPCEISDMEEVAGGFSVSIKAKNEQP